MAPAWGDIDFRRGFIILKDPKGGSDQAIPLNDSAKKIFENIPQTKENPFVFPGRKKGSHLTDCKKSFKRIAKTEELPEGFRPLHGLRHTYASNHFNTTLSPINSFNQSYNTDREITWLTE